MPMHYFISAIPFLFLFYVPTATASVDDDVFLAFVKDEPKFEEFCKDLNEKRELNIGILSHHFYKYHLDLKQKKDYLIQMYEAHLGVVYLMRENWKCAGIRKEIENEKKECEKYRKYLDILYGYLFLVYAEGTEAAGQMPSPAVKPVFKLDDKVGTLIDILEKLSQLSRFFFAPNSSTNFTKPTLSNEGKMNYALSAANSNDTLRVQFDKNLKQMLKNTKQNEAPERAAFERFKSNSVREESIQGYRKLFMDDKKSEHGTKFDIILNSPFYGTIISSVDEDVVFLTFVKDQTKFGQFCQEKENDLQQYIDYGLTYGSTFDQKKEHLVQKYEANLGVLYLMRENWNCDNILKGDEHDEQEDIELNQEEIEHEKKECQKFRKFLDILYEYLFRIYLEAANQTLSKQMPAVKPQFEFYLHSKEIPLKTLTQIVQGLNEISEFFFDQGFSSSYEYKLNNYFSFVKKTKLLNERELNYGVNVANPPHGGRFRKKFDQKLEQMLKNTKKNEAKEKTELKSVDNKIVKMLKKFKTKEADISIMCGEQKDKASWENFKKRLPAMNEEMKQAYKEMANIDKFGIFLNSPFYGKVDQ